MGQNAPTGRNWMRGGATAQAHNHQLSAQNTSHGVYGVFWIVCVCVCVWFYIENSMQNPFARRESNERREKSDSFACSLGGRVHLCERVCCWNSDNAAAAAATGCCDARSLARLDANISSNYFDSTATATAKMGGRKRGKQGRKVEREAGKRDIRK